MLIHSLKDKDPASIALKLSQLRDFVWLDSARPSSPQSRWSILSAAPSARLVFWSDGRIEIDGNTQSEQPLHVLEDFALNTPAARGSIHDFEVTSYAIGYLTYEFARLLPIGQTLRPRAGEPKIVGQFGRYQSLIAIDHTRDQAWLLSHDSTHAALLEDCLNHRKAPPLPNTVALPWIADEDGADFVSKVKKLQDYIAAGDLYQANLAQRFTADLPPGFSPLAHYLTLRTVNPAPFASFMDFGHTTILSASPERLFSLDQRGRAEARPIKGTARSYDDPARDKQAADELLNSAKDRAENTMIVDLLRNDFSKVCDPGSVKVPQLCGLETYEGLHHLVSVIHGDLNASKTTDLIDACFPGGSITGAPKQRAMEIIDELEGRNRGIFCGAMGFINAFGTMDLNIPIRTVEISNGRAELHVGGGITHLSDPEAEYQETLLKAEKIRAVGGTGL